jgi:hypothetical protein
LAKEKGLKKPKKTKAKAKEPTGVPTIGTSVAAEPEAVVTIASTSLAIVPEVAVTVLDRHPPLIVWEEEVSPEGGEKGLRRSKRARTGAPSSAPLDEEPVVEKEPPAPTAEEEPLADEGVNLRDELHQDDDVTILEQPFVGETSTPVVGDLSRAQTRLDECLLRVKVHSFVHLYLYFDLFSFLDFF